MRTGRRYRGYRDQVSMIAHTFANEIVRQFTGKSAFFNTQIVFVSDRTGKKEIFMMSLSFQVLSNTLNHMIFKQI